MAKLRHSHKGHIVLLRGSTLVGRDPEAPLAISAAHVSHHHALLRFSAGQWSVRDLASRNGTWLDGARVSGPAPMPLSAGQSLAFGDPSDVWIVEDTDPPSAIAVPERGGPTVLAKLGILALPSEKDPAVLIVETRQQGWIAEVQGDPQPIANGATLEARGERFRVYLPEAAVSTFDLSDRAPLISEGKLRLGVSPDEEHVEVSLESLGKTYLLPPRAHHGALLILARERQEAAKTGTLLAHEQGWISVDALAATLDVEETNLNTQIYRIRTDFAAIGCADAADIVERRRGKRMVRLGTPRVEIISLGAPAVAGSA